eukprot:TRINITY_DN36717_c0_g1_i1.p1 TRINITY_DN36717_c0_g1~~TRINITY_DN36717_c0_g1_i1.p1  ORF type:complete len:466 (+),score=62.67 TRINITY_DN36717_c0_g1_i1:36-1400(+)
MTAVHYAVTNKSDAESALLIVRIIANYSSDIFSPSGFDRNTLLHRAAKFGHTRLVQYLIHEIKARHTQPSLAALRYNQQPSSSRGSPSSGDGTSSDNRTRSEAITCSMYHTASLHTGGRPKRVRRKKVLLPPYGTREFINLRNKLGETAILLASGNSRIKVVQALLSFDADVTIKDNKGRTPFILSKHWAVTPEMMTLRNSMRPCLDNTAPILSITPAGMPFTLPSPPQSPIVGSPVSPDRYSPLSYRQPQDGGTLTPRIDLMLEFARAEHQELLENKMRRESLIKKKLEQRDRLLGRYTSNDADQDDEYSDEEEDEADDKNQTINVKDAALTPYHTVAHKIDCKALELCSGMDYVGQQLRTTADDLVNMGCKVPVLVTSSGEPVSTLLHNKSLKKIRHRLNKLENIRYQAGTNQPGGPDTTQDTVALSSLVVLMLFFCLHLLLKEQLEGVRPV